MKVNILNMRSFDSNSYAIDIALPVLAIECEVTPPLENYLDAYEETVLHLVSLNLAANGIAKTLNTQESMIDTILDSLALKNYISKERFKSWQLTEDGRKYLNGQVEERASDESYYGYMFINAIKKEIIPYFHQSDIGKVHLFSGERLPLKILFDKDEEKTFKTPKIKNLKLKIAYSSYCKNYKLIQDHEKNKISYEDVVTGIDYNLLDSFDEEILDIESTEYVDTNFGDLKSEDYVNTLDKNMFVRALNNKAQKFYLRMRIIIDPSSVCGYRVESPFDFDSLDNNYFLRQIQWMETCEHSYIDGILLHEFLRNEICKLSPSYSNKVKDFNVFILEKMPLLKQYKSKLNYIYTDMQGIYTLMQQDLSLINKENIVSSLSRNVLEAIFNIFFKNIKKNTLKEVHKKAIEDLKLNGFNKYKELICNNTNLKSLYSLNGDYLKKIINNLPKSHGHSIREKFINMQIIDFYLCDAQIHRFLSNDNIDKSYELICNLNNIRNKVSHDVDDRFSHQDYTYYMDNVFILINQLLDTFKED